LLVLHEQPVSGAGNQHRAGDIEEFTDALHGNRAVSQRTGAACL
jgi:hypothetical protein